MHLLAPSTLAIYALPLSLPLSLSLSLPATAAKEIAGNWYGKPVQGVRYAHVGSSGSYREITGMGDDGQCTSREKFFTGAVAPFDEEVCSGRRTCEGQAD